MIQRGELLTPISQERIAANQEPVGAPFAQACKGRMAVEAAFAGFEARRFNDP
jgi:hypothetical protein